MKVTSIKKHVFIGLITMTLLILSSFYIYYSSFNHIGNQFNDYMERNENLAMVLKVKEDEKKELLQYLRTREDVYYDGYFTQKETLEGLLEELTIESTNRRDTLNYLRPITSMHNYISETISTLINKENLTTEDYEEIQFISLIYEKMDVQMKELIYRDQQLSYIENNQTFNFYFKTRLSLFNVIIMCIFIGGILLTFTLYTIYRKMNELGKTADALSRNEWWIEDLKATRYIELNKVGTAFNNMKHRIFENIKEIKKNSQIELALQKEQLENEKKDKMLTQAQLNTLQMQINPHFLFNTLNIIGKSAVLQNTEQSLELIEDISKILRYSFEHLEKLVLLREELNIIESYLSIQRVRFQSQIKFELIVDVDTSDIYIPPMIIQPLIENSIKHGLANTKEKGYIRIWCTRKDNFVHISIWDNGKGFDKTFKKILENDKSIGLYNVYKRLELQYKRDDLVDINSIKNEYSDVTLKIPLKIEVESEVAL